MSDTPTNRAVVERLCIELADALARAVRISQLLGVSVNVKQGDTTAGVRNPGAALISAQTRNQPMYRVLRHELKLHADRSIIVEESTERPYRKPESPPREKYAPPAPTTRPARRTTRR